MNTKHSGKRLKKTLKTIRTQNPSSITARIITEALQQNNPTLLIRNLSEYGLKTGLIPSLMYFTDTRIFYDSHYYEIEEIRMISEKQDDESINITVDYKHYMTEYSIQERAFDLCNLLGL